MLSYPGQLIRPVLMGHVRYAPYAVNLTPEHFDSDLLRSTLQTFYTHGISEAVIVLDPQGIIRGWPKSAQELLGYTEQEALGQPIACIFTPGDLQRKIDRYELEVARQDGYAEDDRWHLRKDGTRAWVTGTLSAVRDTSGAIRGFVKVLRDRTDLRSKIDRLEKDLRDREDQAHRSQLFMHTLGHELRNPLSPLTMAATLLAARDPAPASAQAIGIIHRQIAVLKGLADDLMDLARGQHAGFELALERVHLQKLLLDAVGDLQAAAQEKRVTLVPVMQEVPIHIDADPRRLLQVILNLLGNALKYTPAGGQVFLKAVEEGHEVAIRVEDTGIGISAEMLPKIFEFFTQDAAARKMAPGGLGVGLGLVRQIVEAHHGSVGARSAGQEKGSEFTLRLPLVAHVPPAPAAGG
ncbi:MAG: PAS domain-containing sensor histidine kinase [Comamonadaceae bacterium]|nr:MAG: PAS domain-containing sensor histidine kinase [Comamonadaceae bacterium]